MVTLWDGCEAVGSWEASWAYGPTASSTNSYEGTNHLFGGTARSDKTGFDYYNLSMSSISIDTDTEIGLYIKLTQDTINKLNTMNINLGVGGTDYFYKFYSSSDFVADTWTACTFSYNTKDGEDGETPLNAITYVGIHFTKDVSTSTITAGGFRWDYCHYGLVPAAGYTHTVLGVTAANMAKINDIAKANISKVNDV